MSEQKQGIKLDEIKIEVETGIEKILNRTYKDSNIVKLLFIAFVAITMSLFHMYTSGFGVLEAWQQRSTTLLFILLLIPVLYPFKQGNRFIGIFIDVIYLVLTIAVIIYTLQAYPEIAFRGTIPNNADVIFGGIAVLLVLEGTRRALGYFMSLLVLLFVVYTYFGSIMPGMLAHPGFSFERMIATYYNSTLGMFGLILGAMSNYIIIFIIFGAFLAKSQAGKFFIELAYSLTGSRTGGPAKVAVVSSGLMGMVQGAAVSNVATTGTLTIPLMKRVGYKSHFAGGVEAAASSGGQIMPPIMGASAFIMAANLKIPYIDLVFFALFPALLHYLAVYFMVHFEAKKSYLRSIPREELPSIKKVIREGWFLLLPVIMIIVLLVIGYSPQYAGFYSILGIIVISFFRKSTRMSLKDILAALELGGRNSVSIGIICAAAGLLVGSVNLTGLGLKFSSMVLSITGESILISLILIMLASILLGMGMPTVSAYVILAVLGVPALTTLGVNPIAAHLFVFYFAIMSNVTPPVAVGAYTAAAIANSDPNRTGFAGLKICLGTFLIPYMFVLGPALIMQGSVEMIIMSVISAIVGIFALTSAIQGWMLTGMSIPERVTGGLCAIFLMYPGLVSDSIGILLLLVVIIVHYNRFKKQPRIQAQA